jgi:hypothetical protein
MCQQDNRLRFHGFTIHSRPKHGPVLWCRRGVVMSQNEAIEIAESLESAALAAQEG